MCGSATLAMVESSACMIVASITETVIRPRLGNGVWAVGGGSGLCGMARPYPPNRER